jgi:hypothetical protein
MRNRTELDAEHNRLKRRTQELLAEHTALEKKRFNRAEHDEHGQHLRDHRRALSRHAEDLGRVADPAVSGSRGMPGRDKGGQ